MKKIGRSFPLAFTLAVLALTLAPLGARADEEAPAATSPAASAPVNVIVAEYGVEGDGLSRGTAQTIWFTLKNTSSRIAAESVLVTGEFSAPDSPVSFAETNQVFAGAIAPGAETRVEFAVTTKNVSLSATESVPVNLVLQFTPQNGTAETNTVQARIPISPDDFMAGSGVSEQYEPGASAEPANPVVLYLGIAAVCVIMAFLAQYLQRRKG